MPRYNVMYVEVCHRSVYIEANSEEEAEENFYNDKNFLCMSRLDDVEDSEVTNVFLDEPRIGKKE